MKSNGYPWQSFSPGSVLQKNYCENIAKFTEKHLYQDLCFDNIGGSMSGRIQEFNLPR